MGRYLIRRLLFFILVLFIVSLFTFVIFVKLPSVDPAIRAAGRHPSAQLLATIRHKFGLDQPLYIQYWNFAKGLVPWPGLFLNKQVYFSYQSHVPVWEEMKSRIPVTLWLTIGASVLWLAMGIPIGIISAIRPRTVIDRGATLFALFGVSAPTFWLGLVLLYVFWFKLGWLPSSGIPSNETTFEAVLHGRFILPWFVLALTTAAFYSRMVRGNLMESMTEDYIRTARAKGMSERKVIFKHGLRSALTPVVTMFGMDVAFLLGGAVVVEVVFQLPGLGLYAITALTVNDFPPVMAVTVLGAVFIVVANLIVDVVYAFLDPRVRYT
jgi:peptide/nickel transport system permease protein